MDVKKLITPFGEQIEAIPDIFPISNDFQETEKRFLGRLFTIPNLKFIEGWLYDYFVSLPEQHYNLPDQFGNPQFYKREFQDDVYYPSKNEIVFINGGGLTNKIDGLFHDFHNELRKFHTHFENRNDFDLIKSFSRCVYYLKGLDTFSPYQVGKVDDNDLNWNVLRNLLKINIDELIRELDWRMTRLNPNNYLNYNPNDKEQERYFDMIFSKTFKLLRIQTFEENISKIHEMLVPICFHSDTSIEDLHLLFSGKPQILGHPFKWIAKKNALSYFLREMHKTGKLARGNYFQISEKLIANEEGTLFEDLSNSRGTPEIASLLDEVVELF